MYKLNFNYIIANFISLLNIGIIYKLRFIKIKKLPIYLRLLKILYKYGLIRTFCIRNNYVLVYYKYYKGQNMYFKLSIVSKPGRRCYWTLNKLSTKYNHNDFTGFYIISSQKGLVTSDYCLLQGHVGGEVLIKVEF